MESIKGAKLASKTRKQCPKEGIWVGRDGILLKSEQRRSKKAELARGSYGFALLSSAALYA